MSDVGSVGSGIHAVFRSISLLSLCVIVEKNQGDGEMEDTLGVLLGGCIDYQNQVFVLF